MIKIITDNVSIFNARSYAVFSHIILSHLYCTAMETVTERLNYVLVKPRHHDQSTASIVPQLIVLPMLIYETNMFTF